MEISPATPGPLPLARGAAAAERDAMQAAKAFEAVFLAEMLEHSGLNAMPEGFGGGAGEDAFASFLTQEYARLLVERGGFGLAESVFASITARAAGSGA
jgi:peptidoglycan hydrolase FlgJ